MALPSIKPKLNHQKPKEIISFDPKLVSSNTKVINPIKRIQLLPDAEIAELYARPVFNSVERELYFNLTDTERTLIADYADMNTRIYFILQLAYFKAKQQFFKFDFENVMDDVQYLITRYYSNTKQKLSGSLSRYYIKNQKQKILNLFNYKDWSSEYKSQIKSHTCELLRYHPKSQNVLRELLQYLEHQKIIIPSYRVFQDIFTAAVSAEEKRLNTLLSSIPHDKKEWLSALINKEGGLAQINTLRLDQKDFTLTAIREEVDKAQNISIMYSFSKEFIPSLKLSRNTIRYYADVTEQYASYRLKYLNQTKQWLHVICFIYNRYHQFMDNLIISFMYHAKTIMEGGKDYAHQAMIEHNSNIVADFPKLAKFLKWFPKRGKKLTYDELNEITYKTLPKQQFSVLAKYLQGEKFDKTAAKWEFYLKSVRKFSLYLRPILLTVPFTYYKKDSQLIAHINTLRAHYLSGKSPSDLKLPDAIRQSIPANMQKYLKRDVADEDIDPYLYEFYIYQKMYHQLHRGRLCCNESISYCDLKYDLINDAVVDDVEKISAKFGYSKIPIYCDERLNSALAELDKAWDTTTNNIDLDLNPGFNIKQTKSGQQDWSLSYDSSNELDDAFFKTLPKTEIGEVMMFIDDLTGMWSGLTHIKDRYTKRKKPDILAIIAGILAEAFGISPEKMAEMSNLNSRLLRIMREDFIRIDSMCAMNDIVSNFIKSLPIFNVWNLFDDCLLADADGQKHATSDNTIQSRYSKKYLGKGKGISLYTLIANHVAVNAKNIGLNEYEGHSLYDMIYNNKTDINIDMVTGDNHSKNKVNYVALDSIDVDYVPSIKNIKEASNKLYSIKSIDSYNGLIKPIGQINDKLIKSQKRGLLRILLSLILQENTQTNIIRKLSSHARYARLKAALFEYDKIFNSTHVLNMIDQMPLRKALRTARNRTESYHQLQGIIRKMYSREFKGKRIVDNRVSAHASRLVANCIIAYNSIILNTVYEKMLNDKVSQDIIDEFARISPIAWSHILFTGQYNFKKNSGNIDLQEMARLIEKHLKQFFWKKAS